MEQMKMKNILAFSQLVTETHPSAKAELRGGGLDTRIGGIVRFYPAGDGTLVVAEVFGLPRYVINEGKQEPAGPFYAFHIHGGGSCGGATGKDPFPEAGMHYNPAGAPHPEHAGDLPPLLADKGYAYTAFYTGRFKPGEVIGRTIIVHQHPDDFRTQPSGSAGMKIACGPIVGEPGYQTAVPL